MGNAWSDWHYRKIILATWRDWITGSKVEPIVVVQWILMMTVMKKGSCSPSELWQLFCLQLPFAWPCGLSPYIGQLCIQLNSRRSLCWFWEYLICVAPLKFISSIFYSECASYFVFQTLISVSSTQQDHCSLFGIPFLLCGPESVSRQKARMVMQLTSFVLFPSKFI